MRLVDANVLLYAVNTDSDHHEASRTWLDTALSGADRVGFAWVPLLGFLRLSTHRSIFATPLSIGAASGVVESWLGAPAAVTVQPTARHLDVLSGLLAGAGSGGNVVNDGHLATLAVEHRARVVSYDRDFGRFDGVDWDRPDDLI